MIRRMFCVLLAALLLCPVLQAAAEDAGMEYSYDFDFTFSMNPASFPVLQRARASGYAELINRLGIRGNLGWSTVTHSMDLDAVVYFSDNPSLNYPFRLYGTASRLFLTSPLLKEETILLNMTALMEFALKAKKNLGISLPYLAFLFPHTNETAFNGMVSAWQASIGTYRKSGKVTQKQLRKLSELWDDQLRNNPDLQRWITALAEGSGAPEAVESEFQNLPYYYDLVAQGKPITVTVKKGSQTWQSVTGKTLFFSQESENELSVALALPETENRYIPSFAFYRLCDGPDLSFTLIASFLREIASSDADSLSAEESFRDDELDGLGLDDGESWPNVLLDFAAEGSGFPQSLPAEADFSASLRMEGAVYPNFHFLLQGNTKTDGTLLFTLSHSAAEGSDPVEILHCAGTLLPGALKGIPDYMQRSLDDVHNVFSFNEQSLSAFTSKVLPNLIRSVFSFVETAPTSACQSFLDDLTDMGLLDMLLD